MGRLLLHLFRLLTHLLTYLLTYSLTSPLYQFLDCPIYMEDFLHNCVFKIQRFARRYFKKGNLNLCLHQHYHQELQVNYCLSLTLSSPLYLLTHLRITGIHYIVRRRYPSV